MSDESWQIEAEKLKAENVKLSADLASLTDELKETRHEARDRRHEAKTLAQQVGELTTQRDQFKAAAEADPENLRKTIGDLQGTVRGMKHERAFERVGKALKVTDPARLADLVKVAGYQPEGDEPDEARITAAFGETLKARPWYLDPTPTPTPTPTAPGGATTAPGGANAAATTDPGGKPGPGADRGQSLSTASSGPPQARSPGRL